jgi:hypothetical protein
MGDPVVNEEGDVRVREQVARFERLGVGGHYDGGVRVIWRGLEESIVHEGDLGKWDVG